MIKEYTEKRLPVMIKRVSLLFMGLIVFSQTVFAAQATASLFEKPFKESKQTVSIHFETEPLSNALHKLAQKMNVGLSYETTAIPSKLVTYQAKNKPIFKVLDDVLKGTGLYASLSQNRKVIHIKERLELQLLKAQTGSIRGTVTDAETGESIPGANVLLLGVNRGAATDAEGKYMISNVEAGTYTLRVTFIGYQEYQEEVTIEAGDELVKNVTLQASAVGLDELVVVGFGTKTQREVIGSVSSVSMENVEDVQASTFAQKLTGKVSGVDVTRTTGRLGAPVKIQIRGTTSINASSQPLYVIDGVPIVNEVIGGGEGFSSFVNLNPNNIESMQILKGAAATAIYGTRGSNGVVLITSKSGFEGKTVLNINVSGGISHPTNQIDMLNTGEYLKIYNYKRGTNYDPSNFANTDWQDEVTRTGAFQKYNASIAGGNENSTFYIAGNYEDAEGFLVGNALERFSATVRVNHDLNERLNVGASVNPSISNLSSLPDKGTTATGYGMAVLVSPATPIFLPNGAVNNGRDPSAPGNRFNAFAGTPYSNVRYNNIDNSTKQVLFTADVNYDLLSDLSINSQLGYQFLDNVTNTRANNTTTSGFPNGSVGISSQSFTNVNWSNILNYVKDWEESSLDLTLAVTLQKTDSQNSDASKSNIPGTSLKTLDTAAEVGGVSGEATSYSFQNNVLRVSYDYNGRYLLSLTGSYNGTSRFASGRRYGFFPAVAAGWIISDEVFLETFDALSFLKLRASYGATGNANIGNFAYQPLLGAGVSYYNEPSLEFYQLANLSLSWERSVGLDIALDYGFLNGRLSGSLGYYRKITSDLLLQRRVSNINGFTSILRNGGKVGNSGIEFNFDAAVISNSNFQWNVRGNITTINNEVKELPGGPIIPGGGVYGYSTIVREDLPISSFYMPVYKGVDPENGDALYADGNGGTTSNYSMAPRQIVGSPHPDFFGGFGTNFSYKGLDLSVSFNYSYGNEVYWARGGYVIGGSSIYNKVQSAADFWTPTNTDATYPEPRLAPNGNSISSRFLFDGSYLRLKSFQIGYAFSDIISANRVRIYIGGTNLLTFTSFPGFDPEVTESVGSNIEQGIARGNEPQSMVISAGIQISM